MTMETKGLLTLWLHLDPAYEEAMDAWYNYEHTDVVLGVPGVLGSRRFKSTEPYTPNQLRYLVFYEMADERVQESAPFQAIVDAPTPWSRYLRTLYQMRRRTNYKLLWSRETLHVEREAALLLVRSSCDDSAPEHDAGLAALLVDFLEQPYARAGQLYQAVPNRFGIADGAHAEPRRESLELYSFDRYDPDIVNHWIDQRRRRIAKMPAMLNELSADTFVPTIVPRRKASSPEQAA